jgi:hypothetical protein
VLLLSDTQASDLSMRHLAGVAKLEYLYMWDVANVSDAGVAYLKGLKELRLIHLSRSRITDKSLAVFANMPKLNVLSVQFNQLTDEGLQYVAHLPDLERLWVCGKEDDEPNEITDAGLSHLESLRKLISLGIQNTRVTPAGVEAFLRATPGCKIIK